MKSSRRHMIYDPFIISRVKQYLEENTHQSHINIGDMARSLQDKYLDYNRRKVAPFRKLVENAYTIVVQSYGLGSASNSDGGEDQSDDSIECLDEEENPQPQQPNIMVDVLNSLYGKKPTEAPPITNTPGPSVPAPSISVPEATSTGTEPAPIDISSDEEDNDDVTTPAPKLPENLLNRPLNSEVSITMAGNNHLANGMQVLKLAEKRQNELENGVPTQNKKKRKLAPIPAPALSLIKPNAASTSSKKSTTKKEFPVKKSPLNFSDVGGLDKILKDLCELLLHLKHPELYVHIGLTAPRGFLLHGPPGSGKTLLANAIAGQLKVPLIEVAATELVAGISGESEERIREVFEKAASLAPCVLFIDEVDVISANRNNAQKDLERRIVSQLLSSLDGLSQMPSGNQVVVIGATNRADTLDPALRRVGRFDQEICLGIPDRQAREQILKIVCQKLKLEDPFNFDELSLLTPGYVGADLLALAMRAATIAVKKAFSLKGFQVKVADSSDDKTNDQPKETETVVTVEEENREISTDKPQEMDVDQDQPMEESNRTEETNGVKENASNPEQAMPDATTTEINETSPMIADTIPAVDGILSDDGKPKQHTLEEMIEWLNDDHKTPLAKEDIEAMRVTMQDFKEALHVVQPSAKREGFITVPDVTWENIGSLGDIREELKMAILAPVKYPKKLEQLGLQTPSGVLLCGPPGCGKTLLAKAVANEAGINFISVKGPELLNMYVGESERAVRQCFQRAKNSAPCVIFFDEFDALCPKRSSRSDNTSGARVVNQLLTEMDGVEDRRGVFLMAATNRPDMIDGAVLRPGRLDKILYVGLPETKEREDILRALTKGGKKPPLGADVSFIDMAELTPGFTGADLGGLVREASLQALKDSLRVCEDRTEKKEDDNDEPLTVNKSHFLDALKNIKPSVTEEDKRNYDRLKKLFGAKEQPVQE